MILYNDNIYAYTLGPFSFVYNDVCMQVLQLSLIVKDIRSLNVL